MQNHLYGYFNVHLKSLNNKQRGWKILLFFFIITLHINQVVLSVSPQTYQCTYLSGKVVLECITYTDDKTCSVWYDASAIPTYSCGEGNTPVSNTTKTFGSTSTSQLPWWVVTTTPEVVPPNTVATRVTVSAVIGTIIPLGIVVIVGAAVGVARCAQCRRQAASRGDAERESRYARPDPYSYRYQVAAPTASSPRQSVQPSAPPPVATGDLGPPPSYESVVGG